jgi:adenylyltransferase and sulfurtransferase
VSSIDHSGLCLRRTIRLSQPFLWYSFLIPALANVLFHAHPHKVILYLAACGVGKITIVDFDAVETSNLHRQVIHSSCTVGMNKAESACRAVQQLNPSISCAVITTPFNYDNAMELVSQHDCVVDASDNPQTRYLVNDACVLSSIATQRNVPLISGSAMGTEGQLTVYNHKNGPCYRCLYPQPNPTEGCKSCADNGVLGPVPGLIGILQSLETLKVLTDTG